MPSRPGQDLIPKDIGAAWKRASQVGFRKAPHSDLSKVFEWIVSVMPPAARGKLMSDLVEQGSRAAATREERRNRVRTSARQGRRRTSRAATGPGRRKGSQLSQERRTGVRPSARKAPQKGLPTAARQERRKGRR
ncbi:MAG: hypothetical protein K8S22_11830 [Betaproteobacteria bacterium]|nr:hypothetical protein [Betaproteobacteria bacterium]